MLKWGSLYLGGFAALVNGFITGIKFWGAIISIHLAYIICFRVVVTFAIFYLIGRIIGWVVRRYVPQMVVAFTGQEEEKETSGEEKEATSSPRGDVVMEEEVT